MKIPNSIAPTLVLLFLAINTLAQTTTDTVEEAQITQVSESVTATIRCPGGGTTIGATYTASREDVKLEEESGIDCTTNGCYAWQMRFRSPTPEPFDIKIQSNCRGVDTAKIISLDNPAYLQSLEEEQGTVE